MKTIMTPGTQICNSPDRSLGVLGSLTLAAAWLAAVASAPCAQANGGKVLPPTATPLGWSVDDSRGLQSSGHSYGTLTP